MARTIREMAEEYTKMEHGSYKIGAISDFTVGARAVVDEIEQIIASHEDGCLALESIILRLSELKEE